jgi:hypothetical protein
MFKACSVQPVGVCKAGCFLLAFHTLSLHCHRQPEFDPRSSLIANQHIPLQTPCLAADLLDSVRSQLDIDESRAAEVQRLSGLVHAAMRQQAGAFHSMGLGLTCMAHVSSMPLCKPLEPVAALLPYVDLST